MSKVRSRATLMRLTGVSAVALACAFGAQADKRQGAPIIFAEQDQAAQTASSAQSAPTLTHDDKRIAFVYPGQAEPVYQASDALTPKTSTSDPLSSESKSLRIAAVKPQQPAATGRPLTLSRTTVNRDARITEERGTASVYMDGFNGKPTANGEIFDETAMTAAHPSLPLPSLVQVINEDNQREVVVRVNDRGPFDGKRIIELSPRAASVLGVPKGRSGIVRLRYLGPAPVQALDENEGLNGTVMAENLQPIAPAKTVRTATRLAEPSLGVAEPASTRSVQPQPVSGGGIYIQAGAFSDISNAQRLKGALGRGLAVKIEAARVSGNDFFRVLIGPYGSRDEAEVYRKHLSASGIVDGFLTTR